MAVSTLIDVTCPFCSYQAATSGSVCGTLQQEGETSVLHTTDGLMRSPGEVNEVAMVLEEKRIYVLIVRVATVMKFL